jgi:hypothetical protein
MNGLPVMNDGKTARDVFQDLPDSQTAQLGTGKLRLPIFRLSQYGPKISLNIILQTESAKFEVDEVPVGSLSKQSMVENSYNVSVPTILPELVNNLALVENIVFVAIVILRA